MLRAVTPKDPGSSPPAAAHPLRSVSLVVPMFNEEKGVSRFLDIAIPALDEHADDWEIVLVDDGSTDTTLSLAQARAEAEPRLRVIAHASNRGLGGTLRTLSLIHISA